MNTDLFVYGHSFCAFYMNSSRQVWIWFTISKPGSYLNWCGFPSGMAVSSVCSSLQLSIKTESLKPKIKQNPEIGHGEANTHTQSLARPTKIDSRNTKITGRVITISQRHADYLVTRSLRKHGFKDCQFSFHHAQMRSPKQLSEHDVSISKQTPEP